MEIPQPIGDYLFKPRLDNVKSSPTFSADRIYKDQLAFFQSSSRSASTKFFERYGIIGDTEVMTECGLVAVGRLRPWNRILTRSSGFVPVIHMMEWNANYQNLTVPIEGCIKSGSLGNNLPQGNVIVGASANVSRYVTGANRGRPQRVRAKIPPQEASDHPACFDQQLFALVFGRRESVYVGGIYISCPSLIDVTIVDPN